MTVTTFKKVTDNAISTTNTNLGSTGVTSITAHTGDGAKFPPSGTFRLDLWNGAATSNPTSDPNYEQVVASARAADTITISATTKTHAAGCNIMLPQDAADVSDLQVAVNNLESGSNLPGGSVKRAVVTPSPDGSVTVFTTPDAYASNTILVFVNGLLEISFRETSSTTLTFDSPPLSGDVIRVFYATLTVGGGVSPTYHFLLESSDDMLLEDGTHTDLEH